jgi:5-methylcytosine-specific restriction endonuclease McrA
MMKAWSTSKWQKECDKKMQIKGTKEFPKCEVCGGRVHCMHHFFPKSVSSRLRYDFDNLIPICQGCHMRHHLAGDPKIHEKIKQKRGQAWYDVLEKKSREYNKVNIEYYKYVYEMLE